MSFSGSDDERRRRRSRAGSLVSDYSDDLEPPQPSFWSRHKTRILSAGGLTLLMLGYLVAVIATHGVALAFLPSASSYICAHGAVCCTAVGVTPIAAATVHANRSAIGGWMARHKKYVVLGLLSLLVIGYLASVVLSHGATMAFAPKVAGFICAHAKVGSLVAAGHAGALTAFKNRSTILGFFKRKWFSFQQWRHRKGWRKTAPVDPFPPTPARSPVRAHFSSSAARHIGSAVRRGVQQGITAALAAQQQPHRRRSSSGSSMAWTLDKS